MRYTGNVNRIILHIVIPLLALFYIVYSILSYYMLIQNQPATILANHLLSLSNMSKHIDGVILGGSNAYYSLSAELISHARSERWLNLSLHGEGYTDTGYWNFIDRAIPKRTRDLVRDVVYSTISVFNVEARLMANKLQSDLSGPKVLLLPTRPLASVLKELISDHAAVRSPVSSYGDIEFQNVECQTHPRETLAIIRHSHETVSWVNSQLQAITELFPNATIHFAVPSIYLGETNTKTITSMDHLLNQTINKFSATSGKSVHYIFQPPFLDRRLLCDAFHHGNVQGRHWRTTLLLESMGNLNANSIRP
ncbi:MAG: hypothetical protein H7831_11960 [Magnetococcus sp. WYHC-3]